jgi:hypothetical protein
MKYDCYAVFNIQTEAKLNALINIIKTILIIWILFIGSYCFGSETESMVIKPINSMIKKLKNYIKNPAKALKEEKIEEHNKLVSKKLKKTTCCNNEVDDKIKMKVETIILEKTIGKIGSLLALSYGETGSNLIEKNMDDNKGIINPLASGTNIIGIFCLCKLLYLNEILQIFGENTSVLLNEINKVISEVIIDEGIYTIKNSGDGLLLIWKLDENYIKKNEDGSIFIENCPEVNRIVDMSLISIIHLLFRLAKSWNIKKVLLN